MEQRLDVFTKLKLILTKPGYFFNQTDYEKGIGKVIAYIWMLIPVGIVIYLVRDLILLNLHATNSKDILFVTKLSAQIGMAPVKILLLGVIGYFILFFVLTFIVVPFIHVFIKLFKGQGGFDKTYQAWVYGVTPNLFFILIPVLSAISPIWSFCLHIYGMSKYHKISVIKVICAQILAYITFLIIGGVAFASVAPIIKSHFQSPQITYIDPSGNFELTIPAGWQQSKVNYGNGIIVSATSGDQAEGFYIVATSTVPNEDLKALAQANEERGLSVNYTRLGTEAAISVANNKTSNGGLSTVAIHNNIVYALTFALNPSKKATNQDAIDINAILNSFKFLK